MYNEAFSTYSTVKIVTGTYKNNYLSGKTGALGGVLFNNSADANSYAIITKLTGTFTNNYVTSEGTAHGGVIYNTGAMEDVSGTYENNYAVSTGGTALGGAIYTTNDMTINSGENDTVFSGNYVSTDGGTTKDYQAVYVADASKTLTLKATNYGSISFYDKIAGADGFNLHLTGDSTGVVNLYNNV